MPGVPHHVTQRGNRRQQTFFETADYRAYLDLMAESCGRSGVAIWAYCLMPNHVHLIAVPEAADSLRRAIGEAHRRYTRRVNAREDWRGHLWQERFASFPMDDAHLLAAVRYVELNPVRAGLVQRPEDWPWSSAVAHLDGDCDRLAGHSALVEEIGDWAAFLAGGLEEEAHAAIRKHERTGRPLGDAAFLDRLEAALERPLRPRTRGRKPQATDRSDTK